jgi:hypothetical protein
VRSASFTIVPATGTEEKQAIAGVFPVKLIEINFAFHLTGLASADGVDGQLIALAVAQGKDGSILRLHASP